MTLEIAMWRMDGDRATSVPTGRLPLERHLEDLIIDDPSAVGTNLLFVARQVATKWRGFIDVLCIDADAQLHVLELKRDRSPRDVVAQTLDYGSWVQNLTLEDIESLYAGEHEGADFDDAFAEHFGQPLPDVVNGDQRLTIVASELDDTSDRIVEYLAERFGVPINAVFFRYFQDGDRGYLARTWLLDPVDTANAPTRKKRSPVKPWNGRDFYVVLGREAQNNGRWALAREHGFLSAGGGTWYWKPLRNLEPGHRVLAYVGGAGYVGVGEVTGRMLPARDAVVETAGGTVPLLDLPDLLGDFLERGRSEDEEVSEYVVPVRWLATTEVANAVRKEGMFASTLSACRLKDERTIRLVEDAFGLSEE